MLRLVVAMVMASGAAGCGGTQCEAGGMTYSPGESYPVDCNTCVCMESGSFSCTERGCVDAGSDAGADASGPDSGLACERGGMSDLTEVSIEFPDQPCVFTLAEAAAGITIDYSTAVTGPVTAVTTRPQDGGGCGAAASSGLILFESLSGGAQSYCLCDTGLCPGGDTTTDLVAGDYPGEFSWTGRNWAGPSDTGNPMGEPFPPGRYTLTVSAVGEHGGAPIRIAGTFVVHVVP